MKFIVQKIFDDPSTNKIVNNRFFNGIFKLFNCTDIDDKEKEKLFHLLCLISKKLIGVWRQMDQYKKSERDLIEKAEKSTESKNGVFLEMEFSDDLFLAFDVFLVQIKSCLDYLVKTPAIIIGRNKWSLASFGNKGKKVAKALDNLPKQYKKQAQGYKTVLFVNQQDWLTETIHARDKINHYLEGGINFQNFTVYKDPNSENVHVPMWSDDQKISEFMDIIWSNLFRYCEDFIALFLNLRTPDHLAIVRDYEKFPSKNCPWKPVVREQFEKLIKEKGLKTTKLEH